MSEILPRGALCISNFHLKVKLGVTAKERSRKQTTLLNIRMLFSTLPHACATDRIEDTVCYHTLTEKIATFCAHKEYKLLEHLCYEVYLFCKKLLPRNCRLQLKIEKQNPSPSLERSAFSMEDE